MVLQRIWSGSPDFTLTYTATSPFFLAHEFYVTISGCTLNKVHLYRAPGYPNESNNAYVWENTSGDGSQSSHWSQTSLGLIPAGSGWQTLVLGTPRSLIANRRYRIGYYNSHGFMDDPNYWVTGGSEGGAANKSSGVLIMPTANNTLSTAQGSFNLNAVAAPVSTNASKSNYGMDLTIDDNIVYQGEAELASGGAAIATGIQVFQGSAICASSAAQIADGQLGAVGGESEFASVSASSVTGLEVALGSTIGAGTAALAAEGDSGAALTLAAGSVLEAFPEQLAAYAFPGDLSIVEFFALNTDGSIRVPLPDVQSFTISPIAQDIGSLTFNYPVSGINFDVLHENVTFDRDLRFAIAVNGMLQPRLQGILNESSGDDVTESSVWEFTGNFNPCLLAEAVVEPKAGMPSQGEDDPNENDAHFYSLTAGQIVRTLMQEASDRGALTDIVWSSVGNTTDSLGVAWSQIITLKISPGTTYLQVLQSLYEYGMAEFEVVGLELRMYEYGTLGIDWTTSSQPVIFRTGQGLVDSPRKHSLKDSATTVLVAGADGLYEKATDATALARRGRRIEVFSSQGTIHDQGTLTAYAQTQLNSVSRGKLEKTHGFSLCAGPQPIRNFDVGDWVYSDVGDGLERLRIRQWTLTQDESGKFSGTVTLNDLFAEAEAALARRIRGITGGSTITGTSQARPVQQGKDQTVPTKVTELTVSSAAYLTETGQIRSAATAEWVGVAFNTDGTSADDIDAYLVRWRYTDSSLYTNPSLENWAFLVVQGETHASWSGLEPAREIEVQVYVRDLTGHYSGISDSVFHLLASDASAPPQPSAPILSTIFGSVRIEWDGLGSSGEQMPLDFSHTEIHVSAVSGFTPSSSTLWSRFTGKSATAYSNVAYGSTIFVRLVSVDLAGNSSAPSAQASGTARQVVSDDVFDGAIGTSKLANLAVVNASIAYLAVNNANIADVSIGKLTAGTITADMVVGSNIATALSGPRVGMNGTGFYAFDSSRQTVSIGNDGKAYFLGEIATAVTGERFVLNPGNNSPNEWRSYPSSGTAYGGMITGTWTNPLNTSITANNLSLFSGTAQDSGQNVTFQRTWLFLDPTGTWLGVTDDATSSRLGEVYLDGSAAYLRGRRVEIKAGYGISTTTDAYDIRFYFVPASPYIEWFIPNNNSSAVHVGIPGTTLEFFTDQVSARTGRSNGGYRDFHCRDLVEHLPSWRAAKTGMIDVPASLEEDFDKMVGQIWKLRDDVDRVGESQARFRIGPMLDDVPSKYYKFLPLNPDTGDLEFPGEAKLGVVWEVLRRTRLSSRSTVKQLQEELVRLSSRRPVVRVSPATPVVGLGIGASAEAEFVWSSPFPNNDYEVTVNDPRLSVVSVELREASRCVVVLQASVVLLATKIVAVASGWS